MTNCTHTRENSWWHYDARGIPTGRVCDHCEAEHEAKFRPEVLHDANYECDEPIDEEY